MKKVGVILLILSSMFTANAFASNWVRINDMSKVKYQISGDRVWFRNINDFDSTWLGCCYAYYLDLSTDAGKAEWSAMLAKMAMAGSYNIGVSDKTINGSKIIYSGVW